MRVQNVDDRRRPIKVVDGREILVWDTITGYVLCYWPEKEEYVTWFYNPDTESFNYGHYFRHLASAHDDFIKRIAD